MYVAYTGRQPPRRGVAARRIRPVEVFAIPAGISKAEYTDYAVSLTQFVTAVVRAGTQIDHVIITHVEINEEAARLIERMLVTTASIRTFELEGTYLGLALSIILRAIGNTAVVTKFIFSNERQPIDVAAYEQMGNMLRAKQDMTAMLLYDSTIGYSKLTPISAAITGHRGLQSFEFGGPTLDEPSIVLMLGAIRMAAAIKTVGIGYCSISQGSADAIAYFIRTTETTTRISLSDMAISQEDISRIASGFVTRNDNNVVVHPTPRVHAFDMTNITIGDQAADRLGSIISRSDGLQRLMLKNAGMSFLGISRIMYSARNLIHLSLNGNAFGPQYVLDTKTNVRVDNPVIDAFNTMLGYPSKLLYLYLNNCALEPLFHRLAPALLQNRRLIDLRVCGNSFSEFNLNNIFSLIRANITLFVLVITNQVIPPAMYAELASAVERNTHIYDLYSDEPIADETSDRLVVALQRNRDALTEVEYAERTSIALQGEMRPVTRGGPVDAA